MFYIFKFTINSITKLIFFNKQNYYLFINNIINKKYEIFCIIKVYLNI